MDEGYLPDYYVPPSTPKPRGLESREPPGGGGLMQGLGIA